MAGFKITESDSGVRYIYFSPATGSVIWGEYTILRERSAAGGPRETPSRALCNYCPDRATGSVSVHVSRFISQAEKRPYANQEGNKG